VSQVPPLGAALLFLVVHDTLFHTLCAFYI
jgi:hypothetical protein